MVRSYILKTSVAWAWSTCCWRRERFVDFLKMPDLSLEYESSLMFPVLSEFDPPFAVCAGTWFVTPQKREVSVSTNSFIRMLTGWPACSFWSPSWSFFWSTFASLDFLIYSGERMISNNLMLKNPGSWEYLKCQQYYNLLWGMCIHRPPSWWDHSSWHTDHETGVSDTFRISLADSSG